MQVDTGLASLCVLLRYLYPGKDHWRVDLSSCFRPSRASHFLLLAQEKVTKEKGTPFIRPRLRRGSLAPALLRGPAYMGHPWPIKPLAASMRLAPLRNTSTRPPEGDQVASLRNLCGIGIGGVWPLLLLFNCDGTDDGQVPL